MHVIPLRSGGPPPRLGRRPGRANTGDKLMTLVASALAGGDCIAPTCCVLAAPRRCGSSTRRL